MQWSFGSPEIAELYKLAWIYARKYTKKAHDREDAAQHGMLFAAKILASDKVDCQNRYKYAKLQVYYGVIDYVRETLCAVRYRKKGGKVVAQVNHVETCNIQMPDRVPDEQWRRDLEKLSAKLEFDELIAKLERRAGRRGDRARPPVLRLVSACGSIRK